MIAGLSRTGSLIMNADMPFDQFTIEQLAGDLLPLLLYPKNTGFHRTPTCNVEAGVDRAPTKWSTGSIQPVSYGLVLRSSALSAIVTSMIHSLKKITTSSTLLTTLLLKCGAKEMFHFILWSQMDLLSDKEHSTRKAQQ